MTQNTNNWHDFFFLRHGQTDWNLEGRFQGNTDIPLNATGVAQANNTAQRLANRSIDRIVSSPLIRALKTAAIVAERVGLPVHIEPELHERSFGMFDGRIITEVKAEHGLPLSEPIARILPPDAEQWPDTVARTKSVVSRWLIDHPNETILFVAHDGIFRALSQILTDVRRPESKHGTPYEFSVQSGQWSISEAV